MLRKSLCVYFDLFRSLGELQIRLSRRRREITLFGNISPPFSTYMSIDIYGFLLSVKYWYISLRKTNLFFNVLMANLILRR